MARKYFEKCLDWSSTDVIPIIYGMLGDKMQKDYMNGKIKLGGCSVRVDVKQPRRDCRGCSFEWNMDKIDIKLELLENDIKNSYCFKDLKIIRYWVAVYGN